MRLATTFSTSAAKAAQVTIWLRSRATSPLASKYCRLYGTSDTTSHCSAARLSVPYGVP